MARKEGTSKKRRLNGKRTAKPRRNCRKNVVGFTKCEKMQPIFRRMWLTEAKDLIVAALPKRRSRGKFEGIEEEAA